MFICFLSQNPLCDSEKTPVLLSTISGGLAALFAIIFSITLIGAQMASRHGIRVIDFIFKKIVYGYMFLFISSIIFPLLVLKQPGDADMMTNLSLILAFTCIIFLPLYFHYVKSYFNPLKILEEIKFKFGNYYEYLLNVKVCDGEIFPESLKNLDNLIMRSLTEKDYDTFKEGMIYFYKILFLTKRLKQSYRRKDTPKTRAIYQNLISLELEIEKRLHEIRMSLTTDVRASGSILSSLVFNAINIIGKSKKVGEFESIKKARRAGSSVYDGITEDIILKIKEEFIIFPYYAENDFLKGEALCQLRKIGVEAAKAEQGPILAVLNETLLAALFVSDRDDREYMIGILSEIWILGAIIIKWCREIDSIRVLISIIKFFNQLDKKSIEESFSQSLREIVKLEIPRELVSKTYMLKLKSIVNKSGTS